MSRAMINNPLVLVKPDPKRRFKSTSYQVNSPSLETTFINVTQRFTWDEALADPYQKDVSTCY
ncbi:hypothetical protein O9992_12030 [Vibrio lentus]|nr:hypothetical protein [Vibrio lentus]